MIYTTEAIALVHNNYVTINTGDIIVGLDNDLTNLIIFRIVKNKRDF